ncbi:MAG: FxsA family protein [Chloroflexota bacterium]
MLTRLLLLFIIIPIIELTLLIQLGQWIGTLPTIGIIFVTGVLGAFLARRQGLQVLARIRGDFGSGRIPADSLSDGAMILVASAVLLTPGVLTDIFGFLCLIPTTRRVIKQAIWRWVEKAMKDGRIVATGNFNPQRPQPPPEDIIVIDPDDYKEL